MHLVEQATSLDLKFASKLFDNYARKAARAPKHKLVPPKVMTIPKTISEMENVRIARPVGECSLRKGEIAVVSVAGGDGTKIGAQRTKRNPSHSACQQEEHLPASRTKNTRNPAKIPY